VELAGIKDILTKSIRSNNPFSVANATLNALRQLRTADDVSLKRGKARETVRP
jgi:small subunit ribosomal protein S5